ncbi:hypothetical protein V1478_000598, partial [Vespula squamosa]
MMDSADLPFAQSTSEVDNGFNGWSAPLFKVALCPPFPEPSSSPFSPPNLDVYLELVPRHSLLSISQRGKRMTKLWGSFKTSRPRTTNENKDERLTILSQPTPSETILRSRALGVEAEGEAEGNQRRMLNVGCRAFGW